jgi:hypothetical protein
VLTPFSRCRTPPAAERRHLIDAGRGPCSHTRGPCGNRPASRPPSHTGSCSVLSLSSACPGCLPRTSTRLGVRTVGGG